MSGQVAAIDTHNSGRPVARDIPVWDPLVRLIHWSVTLAILLNAVFTDPEGELHVWVGYVALGLVGLRLVWGLVGSRPARFSAFPPNPRRALRHAAGLIRGERTVHLSHNPLGALMVYNVWATIGLLALTGYMMGTLTFFGVDWVEEAHEILFNWLMLSVALHLLGVVYDSWRTHVPLVRAMVTGRKQVPTGAKVE